MAYEWSDMAGLAAALVAARKAAHHHEQQVQRDGANAAEVVAHAYSFAGHEDSDCNAKGAKMLRHAQRLAASLREIEGILSAMIGELKAAADAVDENEAKRRQQRSRMQA